VTDVGRDRLTWIGHATALLELGSTRLLTDPVLRRRVLHLRRHGADPDPQHTWDLDAILISHPHLDHLDVASLRMLDPAVPVIVPAGTGALVRGLGFRSVTEVRAGDRVRVGAAEVVAVPAAHGGNRTPWARGPRGEALGFVVEAGVRVYFAGDTDLYDDMAGLRPLDVALIPVWGWGPSLGPGHLDPPRAADAVGLLQPRMAIPIHWGTFFPQVLHRMARHRGRLHDPPHEFAEAVRQVAPEVDVRILEPGDSLEL
jgi:L-ascorbate metabolism protein UlaG (beta-lactamase superfamily)